jgi:putative nucleotidyltransferase with HDIG domain
MAERAPDVLAHCNRVARYAVAVGREMSLDATAIETLEIAARLHDVGKIAMPEALLTKPSALAPGEAAIMKRHVVAGAEIVASALALVPIAPIILTSHEWFDGGGYPQQLAGAAIPLASRIIAVVDAYDTMAAAGQDRGSAEGSGTVAELLGGGGTQFDPDALAALVAVLGRH